MVNVELDGFHVIKDKNGINQILWDIYGNVIRMLMGY